MFLFIASLCFLLAVNRSLGVVKPNNVSLLIQSSQLNTQEDLESIGKVIGRLCLYNADQFVSEIEEFYPNPDPLYPEVILFTLSYILS